MSTVSGATEYEDSLVLLTPDYLLLRRYYFPIPFPKKIPLEQIEEIDSSPVRLLSGGLRLWGASDPRYWYPLDFLRFGREKIYTLHLKDQFVSPRFTVVRCLQFEAALAAHHIRV